jgi:hypothetical protein
VGRADPLVHRDVRAGPLHVRVELPRRQGVCTYADLWAAFERIAEDASPTEHEALFAGTARRVYRL